MPRTGKSRKTESLGLKAWEIKDSEYHWAWGFLFRVKMKLFYVFNKIGEEGRKGSAWK
jgi:hypothetical protein